MYFPGSETFLSFGRNFHLMGLVVDLEREGKCIIKDRLSNYKGIQSSQ